MFSKYLFCSAEIARWYTYPSSIFQEAGCFQFIESCLFQDYSLLATLSKNKFRHMRKHIELVSVLKYNLTNLSAVIFRVYKHLCK